MLEARGLSRRFGGVVAVDAVTIGVGEGQVVGVIGPNGAGKSTLFYLIAGYLRPNAGRVLFGDRDVTGMAADRRARLGIGLAFQTVRLFRGLTVLENVMVGAHAWTRYGFVEAFLMLPRSRREERSIRRQASLALDRVGLAALAAERAESLPIGLQRTVQIARALCGRPRLLLLDEPASGLRAAERERLAGLLRELRREGLAMLLVEHDVAFVTALADRVTVMDQGRVIAEGTPGQIRTEPAVVAAYLG
ncbi:MAG: ABC transporter ATP-binding protein, partial [Candidatus Dormibacteraeota bacterium]|nr:ABC transporter ATP-binding protein [Candidatus Dormibacteraeota bacterium]